MRTARLTPWIHVLIASLLAGCATSTATPPTALPPTAGAPTEPSPPAPVPTASPATFESRSLPGGLRLEEHRLLAAPEADPLTFLPEAGTQDQVLARHGAERAQVLPSRLFVENGSPCLWAPWENGRLIAKTRTVDESTQEQIAELWQDDQRIFTTPAGYPSPALPLQALWTYDGHWALEILLSTPDVWEGQIFVDGESLNETEGYEEAFSLQLLAGRPFYLYQRQGKIGLSYDGQEVDLGYGQVPHYQCCSTSVLNPIQAEKMVAFFAEGDGVWRYVEIGLFD